MVRLQVASSCAHGLFPKIQVRISCCRSLFQDVVVFVMVRWFGARRGWVPPLPLKLQPIPPQPTPCLSGTKFRGQKDMAMQKRHQWDSNPQSLPPESNALPLGHGADDSLEVLAG